MESRLIGTKISDIIPEYDYLQNPYRIGIITVSGT